MLLIINIKYFAVESKQLSVMLLISIIKFLIVMPDVRNLAQAAQGAAAPENVNVVEKLQVLTNLFNLLLIQITKVLRKWKPLMMLLNASVLMVIVM